MALLEARGLCRSFGGLQAVVDVSLAVEPGQVRAVIGPNGAGKTTLFNLLAGAVAPSAGSVTLDGRRIDGLAPYRRVRLGLARTFQNLRIVPQLSVAENVMLGGHAGARGSLVHDALRLPPVGREERRLRGEAGAQLSRVGLADLAARPASALSFGQGKLLEIARALMAAPRLLLLDEPAAGLPHAEAERLAALLRTLSGEGLTILLVEHNMRLVMALADMVTVMDAGRCIADGTPAAVRRDPAVIAAYLGADA